MNSPWPFPPPNEEEHGIAMYMAARKAGSSIFGRIYGFPPPRGPSKFLYFDNKLLVFESIADGRRFKTEPDRLLGLPILENEMEIIAWCAK